MESHGDQPSDRRWYLMMMMINLADLIVRFFSYLLVLGLEAVLA